MSMLGVWLGAMVGAGAVLVASSWIRYRHPSVVARVQPYVRDVRPDLAPRVRVPWQPQVLRVLDQILGGRASVERRLGRLGRGSGSVDSFRLRQLVWAATGFALATAMSLVAWSLGGASPVALLVVCVVGAVLGALACDQDLTLRVGRRERRLREELPVAAELLALTVAAGESPVVGLDRVGRVMNGVLADEVADVLADIKTGSSVVAAFDAMAARTGVPSVARFAEGLAVALERGTPIVDVLHAQAADVREAARRDLIEEGGRREIAMMFPVVFLLLPVTVVFAFFPGYVGLHLT
jgi:tight adherence protein C